MSCKYMQICLSTTWSHLFWFFPALFLRWSGFDSACACLCEVAGNLALSRWVEHSEDANPRIRMFFGRDMETCRKLKWWNLFDSFGYVFFDIQNTLHIAFFTIWNLETKADMNYPTWPSCLWRTLYFDILDLHMACVYLHCIPISKSSR